MPGRMDLFTKVKTSHGASVAALRDPVAECLPASRFVILSSLAAAVAIYYTGYALFDPVDNANVTGRVDYVGGAIPYFILLMLAEFIAVKFAKTKPVAAQFSLLDSWGSIACGLSQLLVASVIQNYTPTLQAYMWVERNVGAYIQRAFFGIGLLAQCGAPSADPTVNGTSASAAAGTPFGSGDWSGWAVPAGCEFTAAATWLQVLIAAVVADFVYYWFHRHSHEFSVLWAGHNVHHSSEHYNFTTAVRQSWWQAVVSPLWSIPFALLIPSNAYLPAQQWVLLYQYWVHTCVVRRMPEWYEFIFVTPSGHRVHHDRRLHKNFGGLFVLWDRMFGTFHDELFDAVLPPIEDDKSSAKTGRDSALPDGLASTSRRGHSVAAANGIITPEEKAQLRGAITQLDGEEITYFGISMPVQSWTECALQTQLWRPVARFFKIGIKAMKGPGYTTTVARRPVPYVAPKSMPRFRIPEDAVERFTRVVIAVGGASVLITFALMTLAGAVVNEPATDTLTVTLFSSTVKIPAVLFGPCFSNASALSVLMVAALVNQGIAADGSALGLFLEAARSAFAATVGAQLFPAVLGSAFAVQMNYAVAAAFAAAFVVERNRL